MKERNRRKKNEDKIRCHPVSRRKQERHEMKRQEGRIQKVGKGFSFQKNYISQRLIGNLLFSCHYLLETASSRVFMGLRICNLLFDIKSWIHYPFKHL